jgi:hypothetical protein
MKWLKRIGGKIAQRVASGMLYVGNHPMEMLEMLLAIFLFLFGLYVMIPQELLSTASVYQHNIAKFIFGGLMAAPAIALLYHRFSVDMESYIYIKQKKRRKALFWISITWLYMTILRMLVQPLLPPIFLAFLGLSLISFVCYIRLVK